MLDKAWDILQHYPKLHWSKISLENTLLFLNDHAMAAFHKVLDEAELLVIATHPYHLKQAYAETLLQSSIAQLKVNTVFLEVRASNLPAQKLYEKLKFIKMGERRSYYQDGEDAWIYKLG